MLPQQQSNATDPVKISNEIPENCMPGEISRKGNIITGSGDVHLSQSQCRIDTVEMETEVIKRFISSTEETISSIKNEIHAQKIEYDSVFEKIILAKESSKNDISIIFIKFFVIFLSLCFTYILFGSIASGFGLDVKMTESTNALIELVKIAVFPLAMLIFGFHFGTNSSASLKTGLINILDYLRKQSDNTKNPENLQGNG